MERLVGINKTWNRKVGRKGRSPRPRGLADVNICANDRRETGQMNTSGMSGKKIMMRSFSILGYESASTDLRNLLQMAVGKKSWKTHEIER